MQAHPKSIFKPSVSIVVLVYNNEKFIPACLTSLFESAAQYGGFCEIIVVDDGSTDHTYEMAWATIQKCRRKCPHVNGKVVRHRARLGRNQALKTGVNKAFGTIIAIVEPQVLWKPQALKEFIGTFERYGKNPSNSTITLYKADALRRLLWKTC